jgi:hypothetical protein
MKTEIEVNAVIKRNRIQDLVWKKQQTKGNTEKEIKILKIRNLFLIVFDSNSNHEGLPQEKKTHKETKAHN